MTTRCTRTITLSPDWRAALRQAGKAAQAGSDQGEALHFESPGAFFGRLTERRWALVTALLGQSAKPIFACAGTRHAGTAFEAR
jgi:predicted transcriptional regulator